MIVIGEFDFDMNFFFFKDKLSDESDFEINVVLKLQLFLPSLTILVHRQLPMMLRAFFFFLNLLGIQLPNPYTNTRQD
jgi:hypothetical protein